MSTRPPSDDSDEQSSDDELTDWPPGNSDQQESPPPWIPLGIVGIVVVAIGWFFRPWLHGLIYAVYTTPLLLFGIVAGSIAAWATARAGGGVETVVNALTSNDHTITPLRVGVVVLVITAFALMPVANAVAGVTLSDQTMSQTATVERLDDVDADNPRIVTRAVADRYASNTLNRPQYRVGDTDISVVNGTPYWAAPLAPDGLFNKITKRQAGTVLVDMTTQQANVRSVDGKLETGVGTIFHRNYRWELLKSQAYLVDYGDPKMVIHNDTQYIAVPYSEPTFHLTPLPHSTPQWGGVAVINPSGSIETLSPSEAAASPILDNQQLYPEKLALQSVAATKYRNGILNTYTSHEDEIEIAPLPGDENDQPFFILSESGPQYVVAVEPYGNAQGLQELWTINGQNGTFERYVPADSLFGPQRAADLVRQSAPQTDWDRFTPAEPILTVIDDREYWQVRVVPEDNSGIAYVAFVDARSGDVDSFEQTDAITQFLGGETPVETPTETDPTDTTAGAPTVIVQRVAENGTVIETMTVYDDESVEIRTSTNSTAGTENATARALGS
ncbi:hypothetical protein PM023_15150 [Halorubrum ezzemoulense]|uniref:hypothetical protein n=1 Tax=Halorubrum ezzemoulense TaxID=337243 RepID=UPI002330FBAE|nr:hypothetical protein [Halorubrum ezzemoulense]MDB2225989.1 hypothetical protein [Halorubrum ezzemoulense]MDB2272762.1 hypothetical protein [Halorubrum ezzemoulense]MDB2276283.1 hypothetical protein [Halorubrum ezzemoulense]